MRITVKVKPNSKVESIEKGGERSFTVRVKAPATEGRANDALVEVLSEYFDVPKSRITIASGRNSKLKIVDIA